MIDIGLISVALLSSLGGLFLLWAGWRRGAPMRGRIGGAALLWALSTAIWIGRFGAEIGIPLALETAALVAFTFILTRIERRSGRPPRERSTDIPKRSRWRWLFGTARTLTAGPLGLAAAMGIAVLFATRAPLAEQTRLILAGLIVPSLWSGAIAWTLCHRRLPLQAAAFAAIGGAGFGLTLLTGA
jgi:hypothetical protein